MQISKKLGLKRSDTVRTAVKEFLEAHGGEEQSRAFERVKHFLGVAERGTGAVLTWIIFQGL